MDNAQEIPSTPPRQQTRPPEINTTWFNRHLTQNLGLLNVIRSRPANAPVRTEEDMQNLRLKLVSAYFKFVIQSLCYLLAMYLTWQALSLVFSLPTIILVPAVIILALQIAARNMHVVDASQNPVAPINGNITDSVSRDLRSENGAYGFDTSADTQIQASLTQSINWTLGKGFWAIDKVSDYAVSIFQKNLSNAMKKATFLDNQIAHIPPSTTY